MLAQNLWWFICMHKIKYHLPVKIWSPCQVWFVRMLHAVNFRCSHYVFGAFHSTVELRFIRASGHNTQNDSK